MTNADFLAVRTEYWARTLTAIPSVTGTRDEADFADRLAALLEDSPAFAGPGGRVWTLGVPGGAYPRKCVLGLVRGGGPRTVVLTGHFDVVETGCYGPLEPLALDPDRLGPALVARIGEEPFEARAAQAAKDLAGGDFLAGRGLLDMKAGLAAGLAVIETLAAGTFDGSLLFIAVPDEEGNSAGARHISQALAGVAAQHGLAIEAVINLDATVDDGDGAEGRAVALGSVGKLLPSALVVGRAAHASDSFRGIGAAAIAGALAAAMEWAPELTERSGDELGAGPTLLGMKDSKTAYDVTTPASVWMYWNVMTHRRAPAEVLDAVEAAAARSAAVLMQRLAERAAVSGATVSLAPVAVVRYAALLAEVLQRPGAQAALDALSDELAGSALSLPDQCRRMTEKAWELSGRSGPAIVLGFASIPYLPVELRDDPRARRLDAAVRAAMERTAAASGTSLRTIRYFPGISDVSFFGQAEDGQVPAIAGNTPMWRSILAGAERFGAAGIPSINAGPWGRDYHTRLERMHAGYGFRVLPALLLGIVGNLLAR
jgi:arginine utilization protein RocB